MSGLIVLVETPTMSGAPGFGQLYVVATTDEQEALLAVKQAAKTLDEEVLVVHTTSQAVIDFLGVEPGRARLMPTG